MKQFFLFCLFIYYPVSLAAQKPVIDTGVFDNWYRVQQDLTISNNGKYVAYTISNQSANTRRSLVIQSVVGNWKLELAGGGTALFTNDSRRVIVLRSGGDLCGYNLGGSQKTEFCIADVSGFEYFRRGHEEWLAYRLKVPSKQLVLRSIQSGKEEVFVGVTDYKLSREGTGLAFKREVPVGNVTAQSLIWVDLSGKLSGIPRVIGTSRRILNYCMDRTGRQLAFVEEFVINGKEMNTIRYYRAGMDTVVPLVDHNKMKELDSSLVVAGVSNFSIDGERLFFNLRKWDDSKAVQDCVAVDIWSTMDARIQSQQLVELVGKPEHYTAVVAIKSGHVIRLQNEGEDFRLISNSRNEDWGLITSRKGDQRDEYWNELSQPKYYIEFVKTGERKEVVVPFYKLSPSGKYLVGNDDQGNIFTFELATRTVHDITGLLPVPAGDGDNDMPALSDHRGISFWGYWFEGDEAMLIYDKYDIWQVDPRGVSAPTNLTNGYGRRNNVTFRFIDDAGSIYKQGDRLILAAFDNGNKHNGFYATVVGDKQDPDVLTMGPYIYYVSSTFISEGMRPVKARNAANYVVWRCSATEAPNYFLTKNFKKFIPLSHIYPERTYNWLQSELVTFPTLDGRKEQGVLYKPENFNPHIKYPVIIHYYETKSNQLNQYIPPGFSDGNINIPYFVSQGYLVFTPDIHYTKGEIGESAYYSIVGARNYLVDWPCVDSSRMGISGHSFGGFETNYAITRCNLFAAACADAGVSDFISAYGTYELSTGKPFFSLYEQTSYRMGVQLLESPDRYIKNSPIFQVDRVTTPVLIINNKLDAVVHFNQGVEFFAALRSLGKKAWLLQYDGEAHSLSQRKNQMDLTIRINQFFDHYLKGMPAPYWMTTGTRARMKGIDSRLIYDEKSRF